MASDNAGLLAAFIFMSIKQEVTGQFILKYFWELLTAHACCDKSLKDYL